MQSRQIFLGKILFIAIIFWFFSGSCYGGSMVNIHKITNGSQEEIVLTLFESYPVNKAHTKLLKHGQSLVVENEIERPSRFYLVTITRNPRERNKEIFLRKIFSLMEYYNRYNDDKGNAMVITEKDFDSWEK